MKNKTGIDIRLMKKLAFLDSVPERDPQKAIKGRQTFLKEANMVKNAVSTEQKERHKKWIPVIHQKSLFTRKETSPMFSSLASIILIATLLLGGGSMTIASAQNSQPDQVFYGVKVFIEDMTLGLNPRAQTQYQLAFEYNNRRAEEIQNMLKQGKVPSATVQQRYQKQIERTIQYALRLQDPEIIPTLRQLRTTLQNQERAILQAQSNKNNETNQIMSQIQNMLQERIQWLGMGISDPAQLREHLRLRTQEQYRTPVVGQSPQGPLGTGTGNPWTTGTPTPGSGYGPGPNTPTAQGGNPWTTGTPTPGSGYGPGPGLDPSKTCTPNGGSGPNPQPTQQQTKQPTQAGPKPTQNNQPTQAGPQPTNNPGPKN